MAELLSADVHEYSVRREHIMDEVLQWYEMDTEMPFRRWVFLHLCPLKLFCETTRPCLSCLFISPNVRTQTKKKANSAGWLKSCNCGVLC